jgi:hypothetical protein
MVEECVSLLRPGTWKDNVIHPLLFNTLLNNSVSEITEAGNSYS